MRSARADAVRRCEARASAALVRMRDSDYRRHATVSAASHACSRAMQKSLVPRYVCHFFDSLMLYLRLSILRRCFCAQEARDGCCVRAGARFRRPAFLRAAAEAGKRKARPPFHVTSALFFCRAPAFSVELLHARSACALQKAPRTR